MGEIPYIFGSPSALMIRSDLILARDRLYNCRYHQLLDQSACYELLKEADLGFIHQVLTFHRMHEHSQTAANEQTNRLLPEKIQFLNEYGPAFLTKIELEQRIEVQMTRYYRLLGRAKMEQKNKAFWDFHRQQLKQLGYPLDQGRVQYHYLRELYGFFGEFLRYPLKSIRSHLALRRTANSKG
jgi:hypothetical protein